MRFVIALLKHETNTFAARPTELASFSRGSMQEGPCHGRDAIAVSRGTNNAVAAYLDFADRINAEVDYAIYANAVPSGVVTRNTFESLVEPIVAAAKKECDAILLDLHGAMVVEGILDAEGELLRRLREVQPDTPIVVSLDFHANISRDFIRHASIVTGYRTYPHIDVYETGERASHTLQTTLENRTRPVVLWRRLPMLTQLLNHSPSRQPMKDIMDVARAAESTGRVLNASIFGGFPLSDVPYTGLSIVLVADESNRADAERLLDDLSQLAWQRREDFITQFEPYTDTLKRAAKLAGGPTILVDHGDNCASGGSTDEMSVLREMMSLGMPDTVAGPFCDPAAVETLIAAGLGSRNSIDIGGRTDMSRVGITSRPLRVTGTVANITDGTFTVTGPMFTGMRISLGRTVVLDANGYTIVVCEKPQEPFDAGVFTHAGIRPEQRRFILLKSKQHFLAGFEKMAAHIVMVAGPGACSSELTKFDYQNLKRPMYPLDEDTVIDHGEELLY